MLDDALQIEEIFWKEKARVKWNMDGNGNTRFLHRDANIKQTTKRTSSLKVEGVVLIDQDWIADHDVAYYKDLFYKKNCILQDDHLIEDVIPLMMTGEANNTLTMLSTHKEVHNAVLSLDKDNVPGPMSSFSYSGILFKLIVLMLLCNSCHTLKFALTPCHLLEP